MNQHKNILMLLTVLLLVIAPLILVKRPPADNTGREVEIFAGADDKAKSVITEISPDYKPWFSPIMEPPSGEIGSLLFALQAALGAGFIGYFFGVNITKRKFKENKI
ncbi:MAG: energy-coupling factor ABC transporter substrate-binding protein [Oligoflexia bacterium]|nr:energy-coupling factor ABC transporter substrate-binding protein [Oligoflexia bacterium]